MGLENLIVLLLLICSQLVSTHELRFKPIQISEKPYVVAIKSLASDFEALKKCYSENRLISAQEFDYIRNNMKEEKFMVFQTGVLISVQTVITTANIYYNWETLKIVFKDREINSIKREEIKNIRTLLKSFWTRMLVFSDTEINVEKQSMVYAPWRKIIKAFIPRVKKILTNPQRYNVAILTIEPFTLSSRIQVMENMKFFPSNKPRVFSSCEITGYDLEQNVLVTQSVSKVFSCEKEIMKKCFNTKENYKINDGKDLKRSFCSNEIVLRKSLDDLGFYGAPLICRINEKPYLVGITSFWNKKCTMFADLVFVKAFLSKADKSAESDGDSIHDEPYFVADDDVYYDSSTVTKDKIKDFNDKYFSQMATSSSRGRYYMLVTYSNKILVRFSLLIYFAVRFVIAYTSF